MRSTFGFSNQPGNVLREVPMSDKTSAAAASAAGNGALGDTTIWALTAAGKQIGQGVGIAAGGLAAGTAISATGIPVIAGAGSVIAATGSTALGLASSAATAVGATGLSAAIGTAGTAAVAVGTLAAPLLVVVAPIAIIVGLFSLFSD
jgi:hypothetical protein